MERMIMSNGIVSGDPFLLSVECRLLAPPVAAAMVLASARLRLLEPAELGQSIRWTSNHQRKRADGVSGGIIEVVMGIEVTEIVQG